MKNKTLAFRLADAILLFFTIAPFVAAIFMRLLLPPAGDGISIVGAAIFKTIPLPFFDLVITESQVNSFLVLIALCALCLYLSHGVRCRVKTRRQALAEWIVETLDKMVIENMGEFFKGFSPFVASILALSAFSSLISLLGLYPPTSDINVVAGWAILVFILITYYKMKCGPLMYAKSFGDPVPFLAPLNIISEVATPISMAFRHYGNVLSGAVISVLIAVGLEGLSSMIFGALPGILGSFPWLRVGLPAVLSIYFDIFSGLLQAYIFAMLTMLYVSSGFNQDEWEKRRLKKVLNIKIK